MQPYYTSARQSSGQVNQLIERLAHERDVLGQRFNHAQQQLAALTRQQQRQQEQASAALAHAHQQLQALNAQNEALRTALDGIVSAQEQPVAPTQETHSPPFDPPALEWSAILALIALRDQLDGALAMSQDPQNPWHQGIEHILAQFDVLLERQGLRRFARLGDDFDPKLHEAIATDRATGVQSGKLLRVVKPGFFFKDGTLARSAQVVVSH